MAVLDSDDVDYCLAIADNLARFCVGMSDEDVLQALPGLRSQMAAAVVNQLGAEAAALFAEGFVTAVVRRRREIVEEGSVRVLH